MANYNRGRITYRLRDIFTHCILIVDTIRYDTIEEINVDSKAGYKLNLAHVARN